MKMRIILVTCIVILSGLLLLGYVNKKNTIASKIVKHCAKNDTTSIVLSDFTDFEWDRVIVFTISAHTKEIGEALKVEYDTPLDLNYGIVFANGDQVVYEEVFESKSSGIDIYFQLKIYPYTEEEENILSQKEKPKYKVFTKEDAVFDCFRIKSASDNDYDYFYRLYPRD